MFNTIYHRSLLFQMAAALFLTSVDSSLGKIDKASLSQQTLMELLVEGLTGNEHLCGSKENLKDISKWTDVLFNASDEIFLIHWSWKGIRGTIDFKWLPLSVTDVHLFDNNLTGTADLTCLPDGLKCLNIGNNKFEGTVDLTKLPSGMKQLYLEKNEFWGKTDFSQLPKSFTDLDVSYTHLEGEIFSFDGYLGIKDSNVLDMRNE